MPPFKLTMQTARLFAYIERTCATSEISGAVREAFNTLNAAFVQADTSPSGAPMAHFSKAPNGVVKVRLGYPVEAMYDAMRAEIGALGFDPADDTWERYIVGSATGAEAPRIEVVWPVHAAPRQLQPH